MATSWLSCKTCSESDPTQDTVKVNLRNLNKENVQPVHQVVHFQKKKTEQQLRREAEEDAAGRRNEEARVAAAAETARLHKEAEKAAAERVLRAEAASRKAEEAARHEAFQREAAERAREEDAARYAAALAAEEDRQRIEAVRVAQEQAALARKEAEDKANVWCKSHGYRDMNAPKTTFRGATKFPLHTAVKENNQEIVALMLTAGVHKEWRDSKEQTPSQLAAKLNINGSHNQILAMLH